ncbi:MAG: hypothetical protein IK096_03570 [Lachnospiraceae bacterium]|nr:hypothetical protein [Lachnospiraceae bacterium]
MRPVRAKKGMRIFLCLSLAGMLSGCADFEVQMPYDASSMTYQPAPAYVEEEPFEEEVFEEEPEIEEPEIEEPEVEEPEEPEAVEEPAEEKPRVFMPGIVDGLTYENKTLGFGITLTDGWTYSTEAELAKVNKLKGQADSETVTAYLEEPVEYVDMDVISGGLSNEISVAVINAMFIATDDMRQVAEDTQAAIEEQMSSLGYQDVQVTVEERQFLGETCYVDLATCANKEGMQVTQMQIHSQNNGYFYTVTLNFFGDNRPDEVLDKFYRIEGESS